LKLVVLIGLAALWAVVLVPPLLRARTSRTTDSIVDFNHRLGVLSRTNGRGGLSGRRSRRLPALPALAAPIAVAPPPRLGPGPGAPQQAAKRRRDITLGLAVAAAVTLAMAGIARTPSVWMLHVVADVLLVSYLALVAWWRSSTRTVGRAPANLRYLPERAAPVAVRTPELALRRTASS
jgi:hypothetical protein